MRLENAMNFGGRAVGPIQRLAPKAASVGAPGLQSAIQVVGSYQPVVDWTMEQNGGGTAVLLVCGSGARARVCVSV